MGKVVKIIAVRVRNTKKSLYSGKLKVASKNRIDYRKSLCCGNSFFILTHTSSLGCVGSGLSPKK